MIAPRTNGSFLFFANTRETLCSRRKFQLRSNCYYYGPIYQEFYCYFAPGNCIVHYFTSCEKFPYIKLRLKLIQRTIPHCNAIQFNVVCVTDEFRNTKQNTAATSSVLFIGSVPPIHSPTGSWISARFKYIKHTVRYIR